MYIYIYIYIYIYNIYIYRHIKAYHILTIKIWIQKSFIAYLALSSSKLVFLLFFFFSPQVKTKITVIKHNYIKLRTRKNKDRLF